MIVSKNTQFTIHASLTYTFTFQGGKEKEIEEKESEKKKKGGLKEGEKIVTKNFWITFVTKRWLRLREKGSEVLKSENRERER